jgi:hypothetical protein
MRPSLKATVPCHNRSFPPPQANRIRISSAWTKEENERITNIENKNIVCERRAIEKNARKLSKTQDPRPKTPCAYFPCLTAEEYFSAAEKAIVVVGRPCPIMGSRLRIRNPFQNQMHTIGVDYSENRPVPTMPKLPKFAMKSGKKGRDNCAARQDRQGRQGQKNIICRSSRAREFSKWEWNQDQFSEYIGRGMN